MTTTKLATYSNVLWCKHISDGTSFHNKDKLVLLFNPTQSLAYRFYSLANVQAKFCIHDPFHFI